MTRRGSSPDPLPSWRPGPARDAVESFLAATDEIAPQDRLACFDNDGTLWCERPRYVQELFFFDGLRRRAADPSVAADPILSTLLSGDAEEVAAIGLERTALALAGLYEGMAPDAFASEAADFVTHRCHEELARPFPHTVYQPMLELIAALRDLDFTVAIVTGGGTEFVRAISRDLYGVPPELVVGTLIAYDVGRDPGGSPSPRRTTTLIGGANEGEAKVSAIQTQLGRRPIVAAGNSAGDREMLEWALSAPGPSLSLLVDHDDDDREFAYESRGATIADDRPITSVADVLGWTTVSMARDWGTVFPDAP